MKCLSLKQPFAELLATGKKTVELRNWNTNFRGEFIIHASRNIDGVACRRHGFEPDTLVTGAAIGKARVTHVKMYMSKRGFAAERHKHLAGSDGFSKNTHGFSVKGARKFRKPIPMKGRLGFFEPDE